MPTLTILRLDAVHDLGGELSIFHPASMTGPAARDRKQLTDLGWQVDQYAEELELHDLPAEFVLRFLQAVPTWPNAPAGRIVELLIESLESGCRPTPSWDVHDEQIATLTEIPCPTEDDGQRTEAHAGACG